MNKENISTLPKPFVFALMPFDKTFDDIYKLGIKDACERAGAYCERVDEQYYNENMLARIYNQIAKADIIVSDMTGRNANVFYETGYAHALNKQVILLIKNGEEIAFNLRQYPHILYEGIIDLRENLEPKVLWCIQNPQESVENLASSLRFTINKSSLENQEIVESNVTQKIGFSRSFLLNVSIHNKSSKLIQPHLYTIAIVLPDWIDKVLVENSHLTPTWTEDGKKLFNLPDSKSLFPNAWHSIGLDCHVSHRVYKDSTSTLALGAEFRLYTELGLITQPFSVQLNFIKRD